MGLFGIFGSVVAVLSVIVTLGFDQAVAGAARRSKGFGYLRAAALSTVLLAVFVALPALIVSGELSGFPLSAWANLLAVLAAIFAVSSTLATNWSIRIGHIRRASAGIFVGILGRTLFQLLLGVFGGGLFGLVAGDVLGRLLALCVVGQAVVIRVLRAGLRRPLPVWATIKSEYRFPLFVVPASVLEVLLIWGPPLFFAAAYGPEIAGLLALVQRLSSAPLTIVNQSAAQMFHVRAASLIRSSPGEVARWLTKISVAAVVVAAICWPVLSVYGPGLFGAAFGQKWSEAGAIASIWLVVVLTQMVSLFVTRLFLILNMQAFKLANSSACLFFMVASIIVSYLLEYSVYKCLWMCSISISLVNVVYISYSFLVINSIRVVD